MFPSISAAKLQRFYDSTIDFPDFGKVPEKPLFADVLTPKTGF
jgi:hypothetical protein